MRKLQFLHRWTGAVFGLLLSILGISGALLVWKYQWLRWTVEGAGAPAATGVESLARIVEKAAANSSTPVVSVLFGDPDIGVNLVSTGPQSGFYSDSFGNVVASWASRFERPELWLFDLHHDLLLGAPGTWLGGLLGLLGLFFTISGVVLWWRTRGRYSFALWPQSFTRKDLVRHHRNLGVLISPLLFVVMLTGLMMTWKPVGMWLLSVFTPVNEMQASVASPEVAGGSYDSIDWKGVIGTAYKQFPDATIRLIRVPKKAGDLIGIRMKQPDEWLPNGRTLLWFDPQNGDLIDSRSAFELPTGARVSNMVYPIHAARVGGIVYELLITLLGLVVTLLGSLVVYRFWFDRINPPPAKKEAKKTR